MIYLINNWLIVLLPCVSQLSCINYAAHAVESTQKFTFDLPPIINGLRGKVGIPIKCNSFIGPHEMSLIDLL